MLRRCDLSSRRGRNWSARLDGRSSALYADQGLTIADIARQRSH